MRKFRIIIVLCVLLFLASEQYLIQNSVTKPVGQNSEIWKERLLPKKLISKKSQNLPQNLHALGAVLMDGDTGRVLYEKEGDIKRAMASTTKIMTAIYVIENCDLNEIATVSKNAQNQPKVRLGVKQGQHYRVRDLLYALMLESYNDCAVVLAEHVGKTVEKFCDQMTEKARELGCEDTRFQTPNGLDANAHYTTPHDLAQITKYALENKVFSDIVITREYSFSEVDQKSQAVVHNKDGFLDRYKGAIGVKTGYTSNAGYCFVGAIKHNKKYLISAVFGSGWPPNKGFKWEDTIALMKYGENNYQKQAVIRKNTKIGKIEVMHGRKLCVPIMVSKSKRLLLSPKDRVKTKIQIAKRVNAPVKEEQKLGTLSIWINGTCVETLDVLAAEAVKRETFGMVLNHTMKILLLGGNQ